VGLWNQLLVVAAVLLLIFIGPVIGISLLLHSKRRARAARRSPLTSDLLRSPGHYLNEQAEELRTDVLASVMALMLMPAFLVAVHFAQSQFAGVPESALRIAFVAVTILGGIFWGTSRLRKQLKQLDAIRLGLDAELAVGQELDQLMRQGAFVFHDFPAQKFNIDHVVIAPQGVFAVETKGYSKPIKGQGRKDATAVFNGHALQFPDWQTSDPLAQAERQANWLSKWLSKTMADQIVVTPVLALPGWWVERTGRGKVSVFSGGELKGLLRSIRVQRLGEQQMQQIAGRIEERCRNVRPSYRESDD